MEWLYVIGLILLGIGVIVIEIIFVPGTTVIGLLGFGLAIYGIFLGYDYFGNATGHFILGGSVVATFVVLLLAFKTGAWDKFSLHDTMLGRVNEEFKLDLKVGDEGQAISSMKPFGKAMFQNKEIEVRTNGEYVRESQKVRIIRIADNRIFVEPIT